MKCPKCKGARKVEVLSDEFRQYANCDYCQGWGEIKDRRNIIDRRKQPEAQPIRPPMFMEQTDSGVAASTNVRQPEAQKPVACGECAKYVPNTFSGFVSNAYKRKTLRECPEFLEWGECDTLLEFTGCGDCKNTFGCIFGERKS